jgi:hypothetical protein
VRRTGSVIRSRGDCAPAPFRMAGCARPRRAVVRRPRVPSPRPGSAPDDGTARRPRDRVGLRLPDRDGAPGGAAGRGRHVGGPAAGNPDARRRRAGRRRLGRRRGRGDRFRRHAAGQRRPRGDRAGAAVLRVLRGLPGRRAVVAVRAGRLRVHGLRGDPACSGRPPRRDPGPGHAGRHRRRRRLLQPEPGPRPVLHGQSAAADHRHVLVTRRAEPGDRLRGPRPGGHPGRPRGAGGGLPDPAARIDTLRLKDPATGAERPITLGTVRVGAVCPDDPAALCVALG